MGLNQMRTLKGTSPCGPSWGTCLQVCSRKGKGEQPISTTWARREMRSEQGTPRKLKTRGPGAGAQEGGRGRPQIKPAGILPTYLYPLSGQASTCCPAPLALPLLSLPECPFLKAGPTLPQPPPCRMWQQYFLSLLLSPVTCPHQLEARGSSSGTSRKGRGKMGERAGPGEKGARLLGRMPVLTPKAFTLPAAGPVPSRPAHHAHHQVALRPHPTAKDCRE